MRDHVRVFVEEAAASLPLLEPVIEIGSRPAEGQAEIADLRPIFAGMRYIGCDIQAGPGVDRIEDVQALSFAAGSVGTVLALDTLEHVADPIRALEEIHRVLRPGGVVLLTSVMFFPIHEHPWDYWRFTPEAFGLLLQHFDQRVVMALGWELMPETVFGAGMKAGERSVTSAVPIGVERFPRTAAACAAWGQDLPVDFGPMRMGVRQLWGVALRSTAQAARARLTEARSGRR